MKIMADFFALKKFDADLQYQIAINICVQVN